MDRFQVFVLVAPVLLFSMVAHEYAHGYAALKQGDPTAHNLGRLTWNPLKHIDPVMTILMPIITFFAMHGMIFGGAKPVPVTPMNYRNYRRGDIIVSMAGIFVNLCLAVICSLLIIALGALGRVLAGAHWVAVLQAMMFIGVLFNLVLAFFNLLPIPPLDGSHVFKYLLPPAWSLRYQRIGFLGIIIVILLLPTLRPLYVTPVSFLLDGVLRFTNTSFLPDTLAILQHAGMM